MREAFVHMEHSITTHDQDITTQATKEGAPWENPHVSSMGSRLRDFTKINSPVYYGSKTYEDPQEFVYEVHNIFCAMGVDEDAKAELSAYQLKDLAQVW